MPQSHSLLDSCRSIVSVKDFIAIFAESQLREAADAVVGVRISLLSHEPRRKTMRVVAAACLLSVISGCAVSEQAKQSQVKYSGFLGDYIQLAPTNNSEQVLDRYIDPSASWSSYTAVRLEPVTFWAGTDSKVPLSTQQMLTDYAYQKFTAALNAKGIQLTDQAGPGVLVVRMALADANSATPVLRTISVVVPQARLLSAASRLVTGQYAFTGAIQTEGDAVDANSGKRVAAWVDKRFGGTSVKNANVWKWGDAEKAIDLWADLAATRLVDLRQGKTT
jgi:hypothetical protein